MISIIITSYQYSKIFEKCILEYLKLDKKKFEIILITESQEKKFYNLVNYLKDYVDIKIIQTVERKPGIKRHLAVKKYKCDYLYFIDDDAFPSKESFELAIKLFMQDKIDVFGGPSRLPIDSTFFEKAVHLSNSLVILSGNYLLFNKANDQLVNELPSVNFFIKKEIYNKTKGFNNGYWPGEDTYLCNEILNKNYKIHYFGKLHVFHYSRSNIKKFIKQIFNYSKTRGYFFKLGLDNSKNIKFFIPSIFCLYLIIIFLNLFNNFTDKYIYLPLILYLIVFIFNFIKLKNFSFLLRISGLILNFITHIIYGLGFIYGIKIKKYDTDLGR